jgi:beta-N-acetylhexosaminidase
MFRQGRWNPGNASAQCVMPKLDGEKYTNDKSYRDEIIALVHAGVGGFCIFHGTLETTEQMTAELQAHAEIPLVFAADFENGVPMRIEGGTDFPHHMALGKSGLKETLNAASAIAKEAKSMGIHWNFAPVCDINSNPKNPIINIRSFGEDTETVSAHSAEYIKGTQKNNVLACAKHFPGHGDTAVDSHLALPVITHDESVLRERELMPFVNAINSGVKSIMLGHLSVPALDDSGLPASLSKKIVTGLLREELNFDGIILTDAFDMKSITSVYSSGEASLMALEAGNDIALMPLNPMEAIEKIREKAENDENFFNQIAISAERIYKSKRWCGLIPYFASTKPDNKLFTQHTQDALHYAMKAVEVKGSEETFPINDKINFAGFAFLQTENDIRSGSRFFTMLAQATENDCDFAFVNEDITDEQIDEFKEGIGDAEMLVFPVFYRSRAFHGSIGIGEKLDRIIQKLAGNRKTICIFFGNPYLADSINCDTKIFAYSDSFASLASSVVKLTGREASMKYY